MPLETSTPLGTDTPPETYLLLETNVVCATRLLKKKSDLRLDVGTML